MPRNNLVMLLASVAKAPEIRTDKETGEYTFGLCYVSVVRGNREVGNNLTYIRSDSPLIMTSNKQILHKMQEWKENDIVLIKGTLSSKDIPKGSFCPHCKDAAGNPFKNSLMGTLVYVTPIDVNYITSFESKEKSQKYLIENREMSNIVNIIGTLCREPKKLKTKKGLTVTQYQLAINRKYRIKTDPPEIKTDYPWVKSYGCNAKEDKLRLHTGSVVSIDGLLQARKVPRKICCANCGEEYEFVDRAMEIVPYETEYMPGTFYSDEDLEAMEKESVDAIKARIFGESSDAMEPELNSVEDE